MAFRIHHRSAWKARPSGLKDANPLSESSTLFVHYSAFGGRNYLTFRKQAECMRTMQRHHMDINGWSDLGYSYVVFQRPWPFPARIFEGRSFRTVPSAQQGHNRGNGAVCVVALNEDIKKHTVHALRALYRRFPGRKVKGHRDVNSTSCPGDKLYAMLPKIRSAK